MKKILIVDDDRDMVKAIQRVLGSQGKYEVDAVYDGSSAEEKLIQSRPDLILLDVRMPGMDGYELCSRIRNEDALKNVKVIIISGVLDMEAVERIMTIGANDYLTKPFRNEFLTMMVERLLKA